MTTRMVDHIEIPKDIQALLDGPHNGEEDPNEDLLTSIGNTLRDSRNLAVNFRSGHGIESTWALCEDAYNGIDDANRAEYAGHVWVKAMTMHAPITTTENRKSTVDRKSTAFVRLTSRYVDAGAAKIGEILLPMNDKAFSFSATPVPDLIKGEGDQTPVVENGQTLQRVARPDEAQSMGQPTAPGQEPPTVPLTTQDLVEEAKTRANKKAKNAENKIYDWMVECGHHHEMRKVIFDAARLGVGIVKGPFPDVRRRMAFVDGKLVIKEDIVPVDKWVSPWNIYPDPACGENIRDGEFIWERDFYSEKQVRKLKNRPGYNSDQIDKVLLIGPGHTTNTTKNPNNAQDNKHPYEVWFFHGALDRKDFAVLNQEAADGLPKDQDKAYVIATMINDLVVHATINPLESGDLPYHAVPWIRRPGYWAGTGVAEQISVPQRIVTAATRALLNNAGITSGPQIVINQKGVRPANQDWNLSPNKIWYLSEEGNTDDIRKAFLSFDISNVGKQLDAVIMYGMRLAEESTSIPLITQGMSGPTTPETLGATQLQNNNANQLLRYIGYSFDGYITVPLVNQYYEYLLLDPNIPADHKGDFSINAHGSIALVERAIQSQFVERMVQIVSPNPIAFGVDLRKMFEEWSMANHLDPKRVQMDKAQLDEIDKAPKPQAPAIEVANIKAKMLEMQLQADQMRAKEEDLLARELAQLDGEIAMQVAKMQNETAQLKVRMDTDRDTAFVQSEMERARADYEHNLALLNLKKEIAQMDYAAKNKISVDQVKKQLATTAMQITAQKELAAMDARLRVHEHSTPSGKDLVSAKPAVQLPGKAANGKSLTQL